jgi:hypothetical protein
VGERFFERAAELPRSSEQRDLHGWAAGERRAEPARRGS